MSAAIVIAGNREIEVVFAAEGGVVVQTPAPVSVVAAGSLPGPPGLPGTAQSYRHVQSAASALWTVNHNLGKRPQIQLETAAGGTMIGAVLHLSDNVFQVEFDEPTAGAAVYI